MKIVAVIMIVTMGATTFFTQRQMMARNGAPTDPQQAQIQKIMLYVLPFSFAVFGFSFPVGVLLYWLTTNVWSMGQQHYVISRMPSSRRAGCPAEGLHQEHTRASSRTGYGGATLPSWTGHARAQP